MTNIGEYYHSTFSENRGDKNIRGIFIDLLVYFLLISPINFTMASQMKSQIPRLD